MARVSVGLDGISDISRRYPMFIRWDRFGRIGGAGGVGGQLFVSGVSYAGTQLYDNGWVDANYELVDPMPTGVTDYLFLTFTLSVGLTYLASMSGVDMKVTWTGGAAVSGVSFGGDANNNVSVNLAGRSATFTFKASSTGAPQGGNYTGSSWATFHFSGTSGPPQNIRLFEAANESRLLAGEVFDPTWLTSTQQWGVLRCMDIQGTNNSAAVNYSDLATTSFNYWTQSDSTASGKKLGVPPSVLADLALQSGRPIWICIPHQFTDAAIVSLASAMAAALPVGSPMLYVEYSNETWNGGFNQTTYCQTQGSGIPSWSGDAASIRGNKWAALRSCQVSSIFRNVFGTDSGSRWTGVLSTQMSSTFVTTLRLVGVDYFLDPSNELLRSGDTVTTLFSNLAGAPYFGPEPLTTSTEPGATLKVWIDVSQATFNNNLYDILKSSSPSSTNWLNIAFWRSVWQSQISAASARGLRFAMYEGGIGAQTLLPLRDNGSGETYGDILNLAFAKFASTQQAANLHEEMYRLFLADGGCLPNKFVSVGAHTKFGSWGAQEYLGEQNPVSLQLATFNTAASARLR